MNRKDNNSTRSTTYYTIYTTVWKKRPILMT